MRVETLCRIGTGKHTASTVTIEKLGRALKRAKEGSPAPARLKLKRPAKRPRKAS